MKPYTYLLKCIPTNQYYYGVRYSKNCHPSDIWKTYYTSSLYIKQLVKQYGKDSFLYEVRKVFKSSTAARRWEQKVLTRLNAASRLDFINKSNCVCPTGQNRIWVTDGCNNKFIDIFIIYQLDGGREDHLVILQKIKYLKLERHKKLLIDRLIPISKKLNGVSREAVALMEEIALKKLILMV